MRCRHRVPGLCFPAFVCGTRQEETVNNGSMGFAQRAPSGSRALVWHRALRCRLCPGRALGPAFLLSPAAVFAFWGGVSGRAARRTALPGAGCSPLFAAGRGIPGEGEARHLSRVSSRERAQWEFGIQVLAIAYLGAASLSSQILSSICACSSLGSRGSCSLWQQGCERRPGPPWPRKPPCVPHLGSSRSFTLAMERT